MSNYLSLRAEIAQQLDEAIADQASPKTPGEPVEDNEQERELIAWDRYWRKHLFIDGRQVGAMADMSRYLRDYFLASQAVTATDVPSTRQVCPSSGQGNWISLGPSTYPAPVMGRVDSAYIDGTAPNTAYAGSDAGGLFKTVNNGASWTNLTDASHYPSLGITSIAVDPSNRDTIYVGTKTGPPGGGVYGFGILKTIDGGRTWDQVFDLNAFVTTGRYYLGDVYYVRKIMLYPGDPSTIYALAASYVFRSSDGGAAWEKVLDLTDPDNCGYQPFDIDIIEGLTGVVDSRVLVSTVRNKSSNDATSPCGNAKVFLSSMGGAFDTFQEITAAVLGADVATRIGAAVQPGNSADFFLGYAKLTVKSNDPESGKFILKRYTIATGTSALVGEVTAALGAGFWKLELDFSKLLPTTLYAGGTTAYRIDLAHGFSSTEISKYWATDQFSCTPLAHTHGDVRGMFVTTSGSKDLIVLATDGGIHKALLDPATAYTYETANWTDLTGPGLALNEFNGLSGYEAKPDVVVGGTQDNGTFEFSNGTWKQRLNWDGWQGTINQKTGAYFGESNGGAIRGTLGVPGTFSTLTTPAIAFGAGSPIVSDPNSPAVIYAGSAHLYRSDDFGTNWQPLPLVVSDNIHAISVAPSDSKVIYVSTENPTWHQDDTHGRFYRSSDGGENWIDIGAKVSALAFAAIGEIAVDPENADHIFVSFTNYWPDGETLNGLDRVWSSSDGGATWTDLTYDLMAFPVESLVYERGSDDVLYAGTDVGVFRFNKARLSWECFNYGLPVVPVTHIVLNYCKNKIRAATAGRGVYEADLPPLPPQVISASTTWTGVRYFGNHLTIKSGATLTLTGTLNMSEGTVISVERGATLDVNGGTITNCCGEMWHGINVWGTATALQTNAGAQGKLILRNGAHLANAHEAIVTGRGTDSNGIDGDFDWSATGGIVQATNATFSNNRRSAEFMSYHATAPNREFNNASYFHNCTFETTGALNDPLVLPATHISMYDVAGVEILGCRFSNTAPTTMLSASQRGDGIDSADAQYQIDELFNATTVPATVLASSIFNGLTTGVKAEFTSGTKRHVDVWNSQFTNVQRGVDITSSAGSSVRGNDVTVPNGPTTLFSDATWGIRLSGATSFDVGANRVTGASTSYQNNYGIMIDSGGTAANVVQGNTLRNLDTGILALGPNGSGSIGLQILCNVFQASMRNQFSVQQGGTLADQGSACALGQTVDNTFFTQAAPAGSQINSPGTAFRYFASGTVPTNVVGPVSVVACPAVGGECAVGSGQPFSSQGEVTHPR